VAADGGFLMVNLWWDAGKRWCENDVNSAAKNTPHFSDLFLGFPVLGTDQGLVIGLFDLPDFF